MAKKMSGRLVALSASAVATIYIAGLLSTQAAAEGVSATAATTVATPAPTATSLPATATSTPVPTVVVGASATSTATSATTATPSATAAVSSTYANGTYSATGSSALGNVTVSVTIASDRITNVQITKVTTKFPVSRIASLPALIIQNQSASVNAVSGATYSSQAFKQAVQLALQQAQIANSTTAAAG